MDINTESSLRIVSENFGDGVWFNCNAVLEEMLPMIIFVGTNQI